MLLLRLAAAALIVAAWCGPGDASSYDDGPFPEWFNHEEPRLPVAGDCKTISAAIGPAATWHGRYSGRRYNTFTDTYEPFAASGCFDSEIACRIFQQRAITYAVDAPIGTTSCRRGRG